MHVTTRNLFRGGPPTPPSPGRPRRLERSIQLDVAHGPDPPGSEHSCRLFLPTISRRADILPELEEAMPMNALKGTSALLVGRVLSGSALVGSAQDRPVNNLETVHEQLKGT